MKLHSLGFVFGLLSSSTGVFARSPVYFPSLTQHATQVPEVSINTFSTWMAHLMSTSKSHPLFYWKDTHRQEALEGVQTLWTNPALKDLAFDDPFDTMPTSKQSMVVISGVDLSEDLLPGQTPSLYVKDNDAQDFMKVALDTMTQYTDKSNSEKADIGMISMDNTQVDQLIDSFKSHYKFLVDTDVFDATKKADRGFMVEIEKYREMMDKDTVVGEMTGLAQLAQEYGTQATVYKQAQQIVSDLVSNHLTQQTTLIFTPWTTGKTIHKRAVPEKINAVSDFQLLFWTGVFLVLVTSGVLVFVYHLGSIDGGNVVLTSTGLPKQD